MDPRNSLVPPVQNITTNLRVPGGYGLLTNALTTGVSMMGIPGLTIAGAAGLGQLARPHLEKLPKPSSGRGAGRASFRDSNNQNRENPNALGDKTSTTRPQASGTLITIDGKTYDTGYHSKEIAELRKKNAGGGNAAQSANGRGVSKPRNTNGVDSTGTALSPMAGANKMLENLGVTTQRYGKFQSNHLPGSSYSPEVGQALSKIYDSETLHRLDSDVNDVLLSEDLFMDGSGLKGDGPFYKPDVNYDEINPINILQAEGSPFLVQNGGISTANLVNPQNKNGTRARYDQEFLTSGDNSQAGLRAADASKGLLYASGKYWRENPNAGQEGQKDFLEIDKEKYKAIKNSDMGAQDFFSKKLDQTKQTFKADLSGQSKNVRDAVGLTADPYSFTAEGPSDARSTAYGESILGNIDEIKPELPYTTTPPKVITQKYLDDLDSGKLTGNHPLFR